MLSVLTQFSEMGSKENYRFALYQCLCDAESYREPISRAGSSTKLINDCKASLVDISETPISMLLHRSSGNKPEDESSLSHLCGKRGHVCFDTIIHGDSSENLMNNRERGVRGRDKTTNLNHHAHESNRAYVGTFTTHITTRDDLKSLLLSRERIVGNELFGFVNLKDIVQYI